MIPYEIAHINDYHLTYKEVGIIYRYPSYYLINNILKVPYQLEQSLSIWDPIYHKRVAIGYCYDEENRQLRIPRGYPEEGLKAVFPAYYFENKKVETYPEINIQLCGSPRDYIQTSMLAFMVGQEPYSQTRNKTQLYSDLDTGLGKTVVGIMTACYYKSKAVIITPAIEKITNQWIEAIAKFTTLNRNQFLLVKGSKMCADIIEGKYDDIKLFVIPRSTILSFMRKYENRPELITQLFDAMKVNIKIVDEAHMDFHTVVMIDCYTNIQKTYYMSSSPTRSSIDEKKIYARVFKNVLRYGKNILTKEQHHIIPIIMQFKSVPTNEQLKAIETPKGPSLSKYAEYLLDPEGARDEFLDTYSYALYFLQQYRREGGKILVICATIKFAEEIRDYTKSLFPNMSTGLYVGSGKDKYKELDNDIVFSTTHSMGVGSEIENHQITINTITYSSDVMADQIPGRIREQHDRPGIYCEIVNMGHKVAKKHYEKRERFLRKKAKDGKLMELEVSDADIRRMNKFFGKEYYYNKNGMVMKHGKAVLRLNK